MAADLLPFARALAEHYRVHLLERRGRGESGPQGEHYGMQTECDDILAVQRATGAERLVGHSYGGLVALEVACTSSVFRKVAVYEPGVSITGSVRAEWMTEYRSHLAQARPDEAFVDFVLGSQPRGERQLPRALMKMILAVAIRGSQRKRMYSLLGENLREHEQIVKLDDTYSRYWQITAEVLLMCGGARRSASDCGVVETLAGVIPRARQFTFPKLGHFALQGRRAGEVARVVAGFMAE